MPQPNILLPSWHLEDITRDLNEREASAILNAYALAFHPWVLAAAQTIPRWTAAPSPGDIERGRILILPEPSRGKLPAGWLAQAEQQGVIVLSATDNREECLQKLLQHQGLKQALSTQYSEEEWAQLQEQLASAPACQEDFLALGIVYLLVTLLSQAMYHYDNIEETRFADYLLDAAQQANRQDQEKTKQLLQLTCEQLLESREKFYPVETHLIDLCLVGEGLKVEDLESLKQTEHVVNLLTTGEFLESLHKQSPEAVAGLQAAFHEEKMSLLGGEYSEVPTPLLPLQTARWQMQQGLRVFQEILQTSPAVWARMRFGLTTQLPLILKRFGIDCAYHLVLDDGLYPDDEQSHFAWEGRSSQLVQSISRIPLSIDNAASLLRIPERLAETMNHDHLAAVVLARWPKLRNPWFGDLLRIQKYAPVLGQFARLDHFLKETEESGHYTSHEQRFYLSPYLDQLTGRSQSDPIGRFSEFWKLQQTSEVLCWLETTAQIFTKKHQPELIEAIVDRVQEVALELSPDKIQAIQQELSQQIQTAIQTLSNLLTGKGKAAAGHLVLNPLSHARNVVVRFPFPTESGGASAEKRVPQLTGPVKHLQIEAEEALAVVELPSAGFVSLETVPAAKVKLPRQKVPLAGENFLQNEFFHVLIDNETGGIQRLRVHGQMENLLSQRLVYRMDGSQGTVPRGQTAWGQGANEPVYSKMVADSIQILSTGPVLGEIAVKGRMLSPDGSRLVANFQQTYRIYRGLRKLEIETELDPQTLPTQLANRSYYAYRFAWAASAAKVRGILQQSQYSAGEQRVESTGPIQIEDEDHRITLNLHHRPFHLRTAARFLDSLLIVHGEKRRRFHCEIAVNAPHSALIAEEADTPVISLPTTQLPLTAAAWLYHLSAPSVQMIHIQPEQVVDAEGVDEAISAAHCFRFDFVETEGKHAVVKFSLFRTPKKAWEIDFNGQIQSELPIEAGEIQMECLPCDYLSVRVQF